MKILSGFLAVAVLLVLAALLYEHDKTGALEVGISERGGDVFKNMTLVFSWS